MLSWKFLRPCECIGERGLLQWASLPFCSCTNWVSLTILLNKQVLFSCFPIFIVFGGILMFTCPDIFTATNEKIPTLTTQTQVHLGMNVLFIKTYHHTPHSYILCCLWVYSCVLLAMQLVALWEIPRFKARHVKSISPLFNMWVFL